MKRNKKRLLFIILISFLILTICLITFSLSLQKVEGDSMEPTLKDGDHIFINRLAYGIPLLFDHRGKKPFYFVWKEPAVNDIIIFRDPFSSRRYIKRIVAKGGDTLEKSENQLALKGSSLEWKIEEGGRWQKTTTLPPLTYFVVGDHLEHSRDSRQMGLIAFYLIEGKVLIRRK